MLSPRRPQLVAATLALGLAIGCGQTELLLSADRQEITAGGIDFAIITATLGKGGELAAGQSLRFETTAGSFTEDGDREETEVTTGSNGRAQVKLFSSKFPATANVLVTYEDPQSSVTTVSSISIRFGKPTGSAIPRADRVRLVCDAVNIGALRSPVPDMRVRCTLTAQTVDGRTIPVGALDPQLFAEAGSLVKEVDPFTDELALFYSPKGGRATPRDVSPVPQLNEPSYRGASGQVRNPRDGLVTLVAVVEAAEAFKDENGNGVFDTGEPFTDSPEPFVDVNDNGQADSDERFVDTDGNGVWDSGNQTYDTRAKVMAIFKILWTGELYNDPTGQAPGASAILASAPVGTTLEVQALAVDRNLNPVAGFAENADSLTWNVEGSGAFPVSPTDVPIRNTYGFQFDSSGATELERWRPVPGTFAPEPYKLSLKQDTSTDPSQFGLVIGAELSLTAGPSGDSDFTEQIVERIANSLTIQ
jgi:hypothetical protein